MLKSLIKLTLDKAMFKTTKNNLNLLETNKENILSMWLEYDIVKTTLTKNGFEVDFFREKFASKVFDFAISVVKSQNKVGNCPVIGVMLMLFKKKNIPLSDVFMICVHFKNALLHFLYQNRHLNSNMISEISALVDYNFEGVIKDYVALYYKDNSIHQLQTPESKNTAKIDTNVNVESKKEEDAPVDEEKKRITSAKNYIQEIEIDMEMIAELSELETDTLNAINEDESITQNSLVESAHLFEQYAKVLNSMFEFEELSYTLVILKDLLHTTEFYALDDDTKNMITVYLQAIINDLIRWRVSIFITSDAEDIHYLDKTLMSSIAQLEITLMPQVESDEDEVEFF